MAIAIFILTIILVIWQPRGLGIGFSALVGALLTVVTGGVSLLDLLTVGETVWNATITLIALMIIAIILDEAGCFRWLALQVARWGMGRGRLLVFLIPWLGALGSMVLTNVATVFIWTSTVIEMLLVLRFPARATFAFVFITGFITDAASLLSPVSNPVSIISTDYFNSSGWRYVLVMIPVTVVAIATSWGVLWFYFNRYIPLTYDLTYLPPPHRALRDPLVCQWSLGIFGLLLIGYGLAQILSLPVSAIAVIGALGLLGLAGRWFHTDAMAIIPLDKVWRGVPWQVILFSLGMYVVVMGLGNGGIMEWISQSLKELSGWGLTLTAMGTGFFATLLSGVSNNLPTVLLKAMVIQDLRDIEPGIQEVMVYANGIGCILGAKITPLGSLSTLLWLNILTRKGLRLPWVEYVGLSLILTLPVLWVSLLSLALWLPWLIA